MGDGGQAESEDEHVAKSRKRQNVIFRELQRIQITQKIVEGISYQRNLTAEASRSESTILLLSQIYCAVLTGIVN